MSLSASAPWLKYYGEVPHHLTYPQKTIYQMVRDAAIRDARLPAYEFMGKKTTFAQFMEKIDQTAQAFLAMGIRKGDRVTICMPNCPQALHAFYGLNRIGAVSNMIHPLSAAGEIKFYLNFSHSKCILTLDQFYAKIAPVMPELDNKDCKLLLAKIEDELYPHLALGYALTAARKYPKPPKNGNHIWWSEFQRVGKKRNLPLPKDYGRAEDGASILYSGGTTGTTKGILLSNMNFNALGLQTIAASGFSPIDGMKMLSVMPVFHGFGLGIGIHTALIGGACCILVPKFNVNTYAELLIKKQPNIIPGVPTLFEALLRAEKLENADLSCLKGVFSGGDSMSIELKKKVDDFLKAHNASVQVRQGYGLTECVTASCLTPKDYNRVGSIGVPFPDTYYKVVKVGTTDEVDPNVEGEICISGPSVMLGYMDNDEETRSTLRRHPDGRIWVFDPERIAEPNRKHTTWVWNLIDSIHTIADAKRIADCWRYASGQPSTGGDDFFPGTAAQQLADYLFAAHLGGKTVADVFRWASSERNTEPVTILTKHEGYGEIAARVSSVIALTPETRSGVFGSLQTMVAFLADPDVIEWVLPREGDGTPEGRDVFDPLAFATSEGDTLYLLSAQGRPSTALTASLTAVVAFTAFQYAQSECTDNNRRLPRPMCCVLDEAANICRWPELADVYSYFGSAGIPIMTIWQNPDQGKAAFGETNFGSLFNNANILVYLGGIKDAKWLGEISSLVGQREIVRGSLNIDGQGRRSVNNSIQKENILDVSDLAEWPVGRALVLASQCRAQIDRTMPWTENRVWADIIRKAA